MSILGFKKTVIQLCFFVCFLCTVSITDVYNIMSYFVLDAYVYAGIGAGPIILIVIIWIW